MMDEFIVSALKDACEKNGLSKQTTKSIQTLVEKKLSNTIIDAEFRSGLDNIYEMINGDNS